MLRRLSIALLTLLVVGCEKSSFDVEADGYVDALEWILEADPDSDVEKAIERKDFRFKGLYGINNPIPGVRKQCIDIEKDVDYVEGTSEIVMGYEHKKLIAIAHAYADHYNYRMRIHLIENGLYECDL